MFLALTFLGDIDFDNMILKMIYQILIHKFQEPPSSQSTVFIPIAAHVPEAPTHQILIIYKP